MEHSVPFDTLLICGVPVVQWRADAEKPAVAFYRQIVQSLARNGYREMVFDFQHISETAARDVQRTLGTLEKVLPAGTVPARPLRRLRVAPSLALALSHITRLPVASLQALPATRVCWHELHG